MKNLLIAAAFAILSAAATGAAERPAEKRPDYSGCFPDGETLFYKAYWMGIPLAWTRTTVRFVEHDGRRVVQLLSVSKGYLRIFRVDDRVEVLIDPRTALPLRLDIRMREGSERSDSLTVFDHRKGVARTLDRLTDTASLCRIEPDTRDLYTLLYLLRQRPTEELFRGPFTVFAEGGLHTFTLEHTRDRIVRLPRYGKIPCIEVVPHADFNGFFFRKGKVVIWISKPRRRMIVGLKSRVAVGSIVVKLQQVTGPGDDFWSRYEKELSK